MQRRRGGAAELRRTIVGVSVFVLVLTTPLMIVTPTTTGGGSAQRQGLPPSCTPTGSLDSVAELNDFIETAPGNVGFVGADVGVDVTLQDGRRLWMFGDTFRAIDFAGRTVVRNSMLIFSQECVEVVLPADRGAVIPDRGDGVGYWPMSVVTVNRPGYDLVLVHSQRVHTTGAGVFDFETLGPAIDAFLVTRGAEPRRIAHGDLGVDSAAVERPMWGAAAAYVDGWLYLYGTARPDVPGVLGNSLRVARVRPGRVFDQSRWEYWDGAVWQGDADRARVLIGAVGGVSQTLSVFRSGGRWFVLSKRDEFLGSDLAIWPADSATGPFATSITVAQIPCDATTGELRYMPLAHPDLLPVIRTIVVSYSRNNTDFAEVCSDPTQYRPYFVRVLLPE